jgi:hypothetical protein
LSPHEAPAALGVSKGSPPRIRRLKRSLDVTCFGTFHEVVIVKPAQPTNLTADLGFFNR